MLLHIQKSYEVSNGVNLQQTSVKNMKTSNKIVHFGNCPKGLCLSYAGANLLAYLTGYKKIGKWLIKDQETISPDGGNIEMLSCLLMNALKSPIVNGGDGLYYLFCLALDGHLSKERIFDALVNQLSEQSSHQENEYVHLMIHVDQQETDHCLYAQYYHKSGRLVVFDPALDVAKEADLNWLTQNYHVIAAHALCVCVNQQNGIVVSDDSKEAKF